MKKGKKYYGYFDSGSTYNREPFEDTSLRRLKATMRKVAYGNNTGSGCRWWIQDTLDYVGHEYPVAEGNE